MKYPIDAYGYLFNARKFDFDTEKTVTNFCVFFDQVYCATVPSEDNTREVLAELEKKYPNFHVIDSNIKINGNNLFDGQLKTLAMSHCKNKLRCIVDFDEIFPLSNREKWDSCAKYLLDNYSVDGLLIPSVDLWGNKEKIRSQVHIGQKFRLHKDTIITRGVPNFAKRGDVFFDTSKSDSTEPLDKNGNLSRFESIIPNNALMPIFASQLINYPYVLHFGSLNLQRRANIGKEFWKARWEERSNKKENVITDVTELEKESTIYHNLPLE